jgi:hypothetical protein
MITLKENIKLTQLILSSSGNRNDDFLKSVVIEVRVGSTNKIETIISKCDYNLTINNDYVLCSCFPTEHPLTYLKIIFKRNVEKNFWGKNSDQIKIKSLKLIGKKETKRPSKITAQDASICWSFEMLSALTLIQSQLVPSLHAKIMQISKTALQNMPPLSLTFESKNSFLTPNVLEKADSFFKSFFEATTSNNIDEKSESIIIYLSFSLARGHLKSILGSLLIVLENFDNKYDFQDLLAQIDQASQLSLHKSAQPTTVKILQINNGASAENNEIISTSNDESSEFCIEPYTVCKASNSHNPTSYNMLLGVDGDTTITNISFKLKLDSIGIKGVVAILCSNKECPKLDQFEQFNEFDMEKYNEYREKEKSEPKKDYQVCFFEFFENQIEIHLELPVFHSVNFMLLKFIRVKETSNGAASSSAPPCPVSSSKSINLTHFKTFGCKHDGFKLYEEVKHAQMLETATCSQNER